MRERIEKRIEQLQEEKREIQTMAAMRLKEIEGSITALSEVITAMNHEYPEEELSHVGS